VESVRQRRFKLTEEKKQALVALGFAWNIDKINLSKRQQMLLEICLIVYLHFVITHNNTNVFYQQPFTHRGTNSNALEMLLSCGPLCQKWARQLSNRQKAAEKCLRGGRKTTKIAACINYCQYKSFKPDLNYDKIVGIVNNYNAALKRNNSL